MSNVTVCVCKIAWSWDETITSTLPPDEVPNDIIGDSPETIHPQHPFFDGIYQQVLE